MRVTGFAFLTGLGLALLASGCNKTAAGIDTAPFATALNTYYQSRPSCALPDPIRFPVDASPDANVDPNEIQRLDALADAGLVEKKSRKVWSAPQGPAHIRVHETENDYDLTSKGRAAWTADSSGGGNFCYATPHVVSIDHYSQEPNAQRYGVSYHFTVGALPSWTDNAKVKAAFPNIAADAAGKTLTGLATLTETASGWQASGVESINAAPIS